CVDLSAHSIAQRLVDALMACHAVLAFEFGRHDGSEEMLAVALDFQVRAGQTGGDVLLDFSGRGVGHGGLSCAVKINAVFCTRSSTSAAPEPKHPAWPSPPRPG